MSKSLLIPAGALMLGLLCAGCSSVPYAQRMSERQAAYAAAAGAPVRSFNFFSLYSWEPLSDTELAVYTQPNKAWLLDLGGCQDLLFVNSIGLSAGAAAAGLSTAPLPACGSTGASASVAIERASLPAAA